MKALFVVLLFACFRVIPAGTAELRYFVSPRGRDSNNGLSETSPFKTLARAVKAASAAENAPPAEEDDSLIRTIIILGALEGKGEPLIDEASVFCIQDSGPAEITIRGRNGAKLLGSGRDFVLTGSPPELQTADEKPLELDSGDYRKGKRVISVLGNSRIRFADIEISRGITENYGGGLLVAGGASVIMESGVIRSNASTWGGGVFVIDYGSFILRGGSISGNTASIGGGAAFLRGICLMDEGDITGNAGVHGGGLWAGYGSAAVFTGGEIAGNEASDYGGGIVVYEASLTLAGNSLVRNNKAPRGGGLFILHKGFLPGQGVTMNGGVIEDNETGAYNGGGSYNGGGGLYSDGVFAMHGGVIRRNRALGDYYAGYGGGIFIGRGKSFFFSGGSIEENYAEQDGGGIYADEKSEMLAVKRTYTAGIVKNRAAFGGGIYIRRALLILQEGSIAENRAGYAGGGVYVDGGTLEMRGGEISGNVVEGARVMTDRGEVRHGGRQGGGVALGRRGVFRLYGGTLKGNVAGLGDAVMAGSGGVFEMSGGEIRDSEKQPVVVDPEGRFEQTGGSIEGDVIRPVNKW
ncbi:MAG: hypothetical protein LBK77_01730 [Spirochaetaceae bacterium]|jgi:predicted outer membrane repeat protein|nr:hypothetical protein [Spirochaetaceae bacterium]